MTLGVTKDLRDKSSSSRLTVGRARNSIMMNGISGLPHESHKEIIAARWQAKQAIASLPT